MKIALLGAESTGKTQLAQTLLQQLSPEYPGMVLVPEYLREWCDAHGRTPRAHEQPHIAQAQMQRIAAHPNAPLVLADTTPLMTAVYSDVLLGDPSLYALAVEQQRTFNLTLVTALDLPWVADGLQRDGLVVRAKVDQRLREVLLQNGIGFSTVYGAGDARAQNALRAIQFALGAPSEPEYRKWQWPCEKCADPDCEHRLFSDLLKRG
jgi:nicotinamide riboside kinase